MNEATFEARLHTELRNLFPSLNPQRITHQRTFNIRLGHHERPVDGLPKEKVGGRLDVLVLVDESPVLLFELKSPNIPIRQEDRDQGISYARLMDKMPPLVVISNGTEREYYTTYDKQPWRGSTISDEIVQQLLGHALACAATDRDEAVRLLLGHRPETWTTIIKQTTNSCLAEITGDIADWTLPLSENFSVPRAAVDEIGALLSGEVRVVILAGPPLSGKTNVLHQFCTSNDYPNLIPLYIDGNAVNFGLWQHLANQFQRTILTSTPLEQVRQWLVVALKGSAEGRLVFVIDGGISAANDRLVEDINELLSLLDASSISLLIAVNDSLLPDLCDISGRNTKTPLGRHARVVKLSPMSDDELTQALDCLSREHSGTFHTGVYNSQAFRHPRLLRVCAAHFPRTHLPKPSTEQKVIGILPGVPSLPVLRIAWDVFVRPPQLRDDMRRLASAFSLDECYRKTNPSLVLLAHSTGSTTIRTAEEVLGEERLNRLRAQGYIELTNGPSSMTLCVPKLPEALAAAAAYEIGADFDSVRVKRGLDTACELLLERTEIFPYGDIVGAMAIIDIVSRDAALAYPIISFLLERRPRRTGLGHEGNVAIRSARHGEIRLHIPDANEELLGDVLSNAHPWLILSHLATQPIVDAKGNWDPYLRLVAHVGSYEDLLFRPDFLDLEDVKEIHIHHFGERGATVCFRTGIVEPITLAMQMGFYHIPHEILELCRHAAKNDAICLASRLLSAAFSVESCTESDVVAAAAEAQQLLQPVVYRAVEEPCEEILDALRTNGDRSVRVRKVGRNEKCPCNSGRKYKRCCGR